VLALALATYAAVAPHRPIGKLGPEIERSPAGAAVVSPVGASHCEATRAACRRSDRACRERWPERLSYGPPWAHYLGVYQDRLLGGPLGLPGLRYTAPEGVEHKDNIGVVLG
jgi:hypothetical protein